MEIYSRMKPSFDFCDQSSARILVMICGPIIPVVTALYVLLSLFRSFMYMLIYRAVILVEFHSFGFL